MFNKLNVDSDLLSTMLKAIEQQKKSEQWTKDNGQYIPLPSTWLNGERWKDEITILNKPQCESQFTMKKVKNQNAYYIYNGKRYTIDELADNPDLVITICKEIKEKRLHNQKSDKKIMRCSSVQR